MSNEPELASEAPVTAIARNPLQGPADVLAAIGTVWIFLMMLLVVADVLGRNFFDAPITGVAEFAARSVASIVFLQLAAAIFWQGLWKRQSTTAGNSKSSRYSPANGM